MAASNWEEEVYGKPPNAESRRPEDSSIIARKYGEFTSSVGSVLQDVGGEDIGKAIEAHGRGYQERNPATVTSVKSAFENPGTTVKESVGEAAIDVGGMLAARATGAYIGSGLGLLAGPYAPAVSPALAAAGGVIGGLAYPFIQSYGGTRQEQREQGIEDKTRAAAAATGSAVLERYLGAERVAANLVTKGSTALARQSGTSLLKNIAKQGFIGATEEGIVEIPQTALERWAAHKELTGAEALDEYGLAFIKGAIGGAGVRGGMSSFAGTLDNPNGNTSLLSGSTGSGIGINDPAKFNDGSGINQAIDSSNRIDPNQVVKVTASGDALVTPNQQESYDKFGRRMPGATTPDTSGNIAAANQANNQQVAADNASKQAQAQADQFNTLKSAYGATPVAGATQRHDVSGKLLVSDAQAFGFLSGVDKLLTSLGDLQKQVGTAILASGVVRLDKGKKNDTPQSTVEAIGKYATNIGLTEANDLNDAADILNTRISRAEGTQGLKIAAEYNAVYKALTGNDAPAFDALIKKLDESPKKGKGNQNGKLQLQSDAGVRAVPEQGGTTSTDGERTGLLQSEQFQPVGAGSNVGGQDSVQNDAGGTDGTRLSSDQLTAGRDASISEGGLAANQTPITGAGNDTATTGTTEAATAGKQPILQGSAEPDGTGQGQPASTIAALDAKTFTKAETAWGEFSDGQYRFADLALPLQKAWADAVEQGTPNIALADDISNQNTETPAVYKSLISELLASIIVQTGSMKADSVKKIRGFMEAIMGIPAEHREENLRSLADTFGLTKHQAKNWSARANNFSTFYAKQLAKVIPALAKQYGFTDIQAFTGALIGSANAAKTQSSEVATKSNEIAKLFSDIRADLSASKETGPSNLRETDRATGESLSEDKNEGESIANRYFQLAEEMDAAKKVGDEKAIAAIQKQIDALTKKAAKVNLTGARTNYGTANKDAAEEADAEQDNAVQKPSTKKVSVRKGTGSSKAVGKGNAEERQATDEGKAETKEVSAEEKERLRKEQQARLDAEEKAKAEALKQSKEYKDAEQLAAKLWDANTVSIPNTADWANTTPEVKEAFVEKVFNGDISEKSAASAISNTAQDVAADKVARKDGKPVPKREPQMTDVVLTEEEKAQIAWDQVAKEFPDAPRFADLTEEQREVFTDFGQDNWSREDVLLELHRLDVKFSRSDEKSLGKLSKEEILADLRVFIRGVNSRVVVVVQSANELPAAVRHGQDLTDVQGVVYNGVAYLVADNIAPGMARAVFMHEVGAHLGIKNVLTPEQYKNLVAQLVVWANSTDGSVESQLAIKALARMQAANVKQGQKDHEFIAYFIEEAIRAGIDPTAANKRTAFGRWMDQVYRAFKIAVNKLGFNGDAMTAQDVINLAYGAARLEMASKWHGTASVFDRFDHTFMGSGEGAQRFSWGTYLGEAKGTGMFYMEEDTKRKGQLVSTGSLMRTDVKVQENEMLNWDAEMTEQDPNVIRLMKKDPLLRRILETPPPTNGLGLWPVKAERKTGQEFYEMLAKALFYGPPKLSSKGKILDFDHRAASIYLDKAGIKGTKFFDQVTRQGMYDEHMTGEQYEDTPTYNYVIYNDKNIVRVATMVGGTNQDVLFSKAASTSQTNATKGAQGVISRLAPGLRGAVEHIHSVLYGTNKKRLVVMQLEDIADEAKKFMPSVAQYITSSHKRNRIAAEMQNDISRIVVEFEKLKPEVRSKVENIIASSTVHDTWAYDPNINGVTFDATTEIAKAYRELDEPARKVIRDVFRVGHDQLLQKQEAIRQVIDESFANQMAEAKTPDEVKKVLADKASMTRKFNSVLNINSTAPYAPLMRFGSFIVVAKSSEYAEAERNDDSKAIAKLESDGKHYVVQFAETMGEARRISKQLAETGDYESVSEPFEKSLAREHLYHGADLHQGFSKLRRVLAAERGAEGANPVNTKLEQLVNELYLLSLAENSARKSELQRRKIMGFDLEMMKAFLTQGFANAHFVANLKTNDDKFEALENMQKEAKANQTQANPFLNEIVAHEAMSLDYKPTSFGDQLRKLVGDYFLTFSPSFYLQQSLQTFVLTLPYISGKYSYTKSAAAIASAYNDVFHMLKDAGAQPLNIFKAKNSGEREMFQTLIGRGRIDVDIDAGGKDYTSAEKNLYTKTTNKLRGVISQIEAINRATAALATYRLEMQKSGDHDTAVAAADDTVRRTHGAYDSLNTPRLFKLNEVTKTVSQFRRFQVIQFTMLAKLMHEATKGGTRDERQMAKKQLMFVIGHSLALAGVKGAPVYGLAALMYTVLNALFGEADDPEDFEAWLRRHGGLLLARGIPAAAGLDVSGKLGSGSVMQLLPYNDITAKTFTTKSGFLDYASGFGGPILGMLSTKMVPAMAHLAGGNYYKALETGMPNGINNLFKAVHFMDEGVVTSKGERVMSPAELSAADVLFQAIGLPTTKVTERQYLQSQLYQYEEAYRDKSQNIKRDYVRAYEADNYAAMDKARKQWSQLQDARREAGFRVQPISELMRAPREQMKRERGVVGGVVTSRGNREFVTRQAESLGLTPR